LARIREEAVERQEAMRERAREIEDINNEARDKMLRRTGETERADAESILNRARREIEDAKGDVEKEAAIMRNAEEDILSLRPDQRPSFEVLGSQQVSATAFGAGTQQRELLDVQKQALGFLRQMASNSGLAIAG
jgi:hypothetical protein